MKKAIYYLIILSSFVTSSLCAQLPSYLPAEGLVGWWPFNGNANDESGNGNNGNVNGAILTNDRFGNSNKAYSFDGISDFIEIVNTLLPNVNTSFSVSFWFNTNLNTVQAIISESSPIPNNTNYKYAINFSTILNVSTSNGISSNGVQSQSQIITGQWIFGSMVYNSSAQNIKVYFNGIEEGVISNTIYSNQNNATQIGRGIAGGSGIPGAYMSGKIDDIGIWNRALTQQEISALYTGVPTDNNGGGSTANATVPAGISYQAAARNPQGQPLSNTELQVKFTLLADSLTGTAEYSELHSLTTNDLGLFTTAFGTGTPLSGSFATINWAAGNKYLKVELDAGSGFMNMGAQQLLSVPYSMHSQTSAAIQNNALPAYANNAAALAGGLQAGQIYRTATGDLKIVY